MSYPPANQLDEIYPNLWLGGISAAESADVLEAYAITDIISITSHRPKIPKGLNIRKKHFRLRDNTTADLLSILPECISRLESILSEEDGGIDEFGRQRRVLVHCRMGMSRSGGIVVAYAMKYAQIPSSLALEYVRSRRPIVHPNRAFMAQLTVWGECGYNTALLVHTEEDDVGGTLSEDPEGNVAGTLQLEESVIDGGRAPELVGERDEEEDEEELLRKALEMSLLPEITPENSGGGDTGDSMDWIKAEARADLVGVGQFGSDNEGLVATLVESHEANQDTEMGELLPPLRSKGNENQVLERRDTVQEQVISSQNAGDLILPKSLPTQLGVIPPLMVHGELDPCLEETISRENTTPIGMQNLYPEQRRRGNRDDVDGPEDAETLSLSTENGWAEVVMGDVMKRCFEECVRDIDKELGLGWAVATSN